MTVMAAEAPVDLAELLRRMRFPVVVVLIAAGLVTLLAVLGTEPNSSPLDPRNTAPDGAHALSVLLSNRGDSVTVATSVAQLSSSSDTTIVVSAPSLVSDRALHAITGTNATVLLVDPADNALAALGVPATADAITAGAATTDPGCTLPAAVTAGSVRISGDLYAARGPVSRCYIQNGDAALLESTRPDRAPTFVIGSPSTLSNAHLASQGDAALALSIIDNDNVQWVPGGLNAGPVPASRRGLYHLLPARLLWASLQLFIAVFVLALWRARRLGRPVVEPLPVVVRAAETVEGRARLMHAAKARGAAARSLRTAAIRRLSHSLRLGADEDPASVIGLVAERTNRSAAEVQSVLYGGEPPDDAALVRLAQELPRLETAVHQDDAPTGGQQ
jgi:hypothetical protein